MNKKKRTTLNIGFASILTVFITICLVTLSALSVLTANSDYRLSKKTAEKTTAYYEADTIARKAICSIDHVLYDLYADSTDISTCFDTLTAETLSSSLPKEISNLTITESMDTGETLISYEVTISEVQTLCVSLEVSYPDSADDSFLTITRWQSRTSNEPDSSDNTMHLYGGD